MKKLKIISLFILLSFSNAVHATITKITITEVGFPNSSSLIFTSFNWNRLRINQKIPLVRGHNYEIMLTGTLIQSSGDAAAFIIGTNNAPAGVTIVKMLAPDGSKAFQVNIASSAVDGQDFVIRNRYLIETNGTACGGTESFCGDNVKFEIVNQGRITSVAISPTPLRNADIIIFRLNTTYTLTFTLAGESGNETIGIDPIPGITASNDLVFVSPFVSGRTASTFNVQIKCTSPTQGIYNLQNVLKRSFMDSDVDDVYRDLSGGGRHYYLYSMDALLNSGSNYNLLKVLAGN